MPHELLNSILEGDDFFSQRVLLFPRFMDLEIKLSKESSQEVNRVHIVVVWDLFSPER